MKKIWKYELYVGPDAVHDMPAFSRILSVQMQDGKPVLWAEVNPREDRVTRKFRVYGTGQEIDDFGGHYVGTFQDGPFVGHVYEL